MDKDLLMAQQVLISNSQTALTNSDDVTSEDLVNVYQPYLEQLKIDNDFKKALVQAGKDILLGFAGMALTKSLFKAGLEFEQTGTVTSTFFRTILTKILKH